MSRRGRVSTDRPVSASSCICAEVIMTTLRAVLETYGIPGALYTDRAR